MRARFRQRGTTLIEILVSVILLSVGLLGMVGMHARTTQTGVDSENRANAALLANELVSVMWTKHVNTNTADVAAAFNNWQAIPSRALPGGAAYTIGAPDATNTVQITITWQAPGQQSATTTVTNQFFTKVVIQ